MAFTRPGDDTCAKNKRIYESTGVLSYLMDPNKYYNKNPCLVDQGIIAGNNVSLYAGNMVHLESDLTGRTRASSKCPGNLYLPGTIIQGTATASCKHRKAVNCAMAGSKCSSSQCVQNKLLHLPMSKMFNYSPKVNYTGIPETPSMKDINKPVTGKWTTQFAKPWTD